MTDPAAALATRLANIEKRTGKSLGERVDGWHAGPKAALRPIHDRPMAAIDAVLIGWIRRACDAAA